MAEDAPSSSNAPSPGDTPPTVNISIISPSLAVNAPLNFTGLPSSTTVGQLKEKIREALDAKPANEQQRLIHQGKLLNRESETLLDVFGEQKVPHLPPYCLSQAHGTNSLHTAPGLGPGGHPPRHPRLRRPSARLQPGPSRS